MSDTPLPATSLPTTSPDVLAARLTEEAVLLDLASKRYFQLNATGTEIWDGLAAGLDHDALVARLVDTFEVTPSAAAAAVDAFVGELRTRALVR